MSYRVGNAEDRLRLRHMSAKRYDYRSSLTCTTTLEPVTARFYIMWGSFCEVVFPEFQILSQRKVCRASGSGYRLIKLMSCTTAWSNFDREMHLNGSCFFLNGTMHLNGKCQFCIYQILAFSKRFRFLLRSLCLNRKIVTRNRTFLGDDGIVKNCCEFWLTSIFHCFIWLAASLHKISTACYLKRMRKLHLWIECNFWRGE